MATGLLCVIVLATCFAFINGVHDASTSIATSVATRALTPVYAVCLAAGFNLVGSLLGHGVASTVASSLVQPGLGAVALVLIGSALLGAIAWDLVTWRQGIPSSSSHALIGGLAGASVAAGAHVHWEAMLTLVVLPMVLVPTTALLLSYLVTNVVLWSGSRSDPGRVYPRFEHAQSISAAALALGHGLQDGQKTAAAILLALVAVGEQMPAETPWWIRLLAGFALAAGTLSGGWRIARTLGRRLVDLDAPQGFAAESVSASMLYASAYGLGVPVSTTHTTTAAVVGTGLTKRWSAVRWRIVRDISWAWLLTPLVSGLIAAVCCQIGLIALVA